MSPRGGWRGGGRPLKEQGKPREHFGCRIKASNLAWIQEQREQLGLSAGEIIDLALELLQEHPKKLIVAEESKEEDDLN